jgi:FkbM family methyltransferase
VVWRWNRAIGRICFSVHGHVVTVLPGDHGISRELSVYQMHEPLTTQLVKQFLKPGMNVVDIGGNLGYYALLEAQMVGDAGRVIAIEPVAANFAQLSKNVEANGYRNILLHNVAIGSSNGTVPMYLSKKSNWHSLHPVPWETREITVRVSTLDALLAQHELPSVDLVRMDLEGYEVEVIRGMAETIKNYSPRLLVELHPQVAGPEAIVGYLRHLKALGYELEWVLDNERDRPIRWRFLHAEKISLDELLTDLRMTTDARTLMVLLARNVAKRFPLERNSSWTPAETVFGACTPVPGE